MNKAEIFQAFRRNFHRAGLSLKKHSPEILVVAGVAGAVTSAVMACKATTKLSGILDESKKEINQIHEYVDEHGFSEEYTEDDSKKDLTIVYAHTGLNLIKLYAPSVILGALSIASILASNNIIRKRNMALAAAYAAVDSNFKDYRKRVIERFGKELDKELKYNIKAKEIEETVVDENGEETVVKKTVNTATIEGHSEFAKFFDEQSSCWSKDADYNLMFLKRVQDQANDKLATRGHLFLNEVYDMLDIPRTRAGAIVGWIYDKNREDSDGFVDFGLYDNALNDEAKRLFINGNERSVLLDFNVDGVIYDLIK